MKGRKFAGLGLAVSLLLVVAIMPTACAPAPAGPVTWKIANFTGPGFWNTDTIIWFVDEVKARTNGQLILEHYPSGAAGFSQTDALAAVRDGRIEAHWVWGPAVASEQQSLEAQSIPGFVPGDLKVHQAVAQLVQPELEKQLEKHNVITYMHAFAEHRQIYSSVPIRNLAEMKGKKVRTQGALESDFQAKLGGVPTSVSSPEVYPALQRGIVDGAWITDAACWTFKWWEVTKYIIDLRVAGASGMLLINKDAFDALPNDIQKTLRDLQPLFADKLYENMTKLASGARQKLTTEGGMEVITWPEADILKMQQIAMELWGPWYQNADEEARTIYDITDDYLKKSGYR